MIEKIHKSVRKTVMQDIPLYSNGNDNVPMDRTAILAKNPSAYRYRWKEMRKTYYDMPSNIILKKMEDDVGIGLVAMDFIKSSRKIKGIIGYFSVQVPKSKCEGTSVVDHYLKVKDCSMPSMRRIKQFTNLYGNLSFINHACDKHANCVPFDVKNKFETHWTCLNTKRRIKK